jgi:hypothetical protein
MIFLYFEAPNLLGIPSIQAYDRFNQENGAHFTILFNCFIYLQTFNFFNSRKLNRVDVLPLTNSS